MQRRTRFLGLTMFLTVCSTGMAAALGLGDAIPSAHTKMTNVDGRELSIADAAGPAGTLVVFTCNHCPWVQAWETRLVELGNGCAAKGIGAIFVNSNDPAAYADDSLEAMRERARAKNYGVPYVVDATSEVAREFGATHTPEVFLFDKGGKLVYHGAIDDNARDPGKVSHPYLRDALVAVAAGKDANPKETKALGCSLKLRGK